MLDIELAMIVLFVFSPLIAAVLLELAKGLRWALRRREKRHEEEQHFEPYTENDPEWGKGCDPEEPEEG